MKDKHNQLVFRQQQLTKEFITIHRHHFPDDDFGLSDLMKRKRLKISPYRQFIKIINFGWPKENRVMNVKQAKNIAIADWLRSIGHVPTAHKGDSLWYLSPLRSEISASFKVNATRNEWYDFRIGQGGDLLSLVCLLYKTDVSGALKILEHAPIAPLSLSFGQQKSDAATPKFVIMEVRPLTHPALLRYCTDRGISQRIAAVCCREVHYRHGVKTYFAVGFANDSGGWELRNAYFKGCIAPKDCTHLRNGSEHCAVFEGFFDFLSYLILEPIASDYLILNSTALLSKAIERLQTYQSVSLYLDNDPTGQQATQELIAHLGERATDRSSLYADHKDLNEYLFAKNIV